MDAVSLYQKKYRIESGDVDFNDKVKLSSVFGYFQDIACLHADNLGVGVAAIERFGVGWALIRIKVELIRYPVWNEEILIETWYQEPKKFEFERDFSIRDLDFNGHLNNSKYVDLIMDCLTAEHQNWYLVKTIEVNYINEALAEDTIVIFKDLSAFSSGLIYFEGINEQNHRTIFKAQIAIAAG
jgi:acyl-ACP thioesterase